MASATPRRHPRIVPDSPLTVAIENDRGVCLGYGVVANVSLAGACVLTSAALPVGARLSFTLSFSRPAEIHQVEGTVVWDGAGETSGPNPAHRLGVAWQDTPSGCEERLRGLVRGAVEVVFKPRSLMALRRARGAT